MLYFASFSFCSYKNTFCFSPMIKCGISFANTLTQIMIIYNWLSYLSTFNFDFLEFILIFMWVLRRWNLQKQSQVGIIDYFHYINIYYTMTQVTFTIPINASSSSLCFFTCRLAMAPFHRFCIFVAAIATDMVSMVFPETIEITFEHFQRLRMN